MSMKILVLFLTVALFAGGCNEGNQSSVSADYGSLRVQQITLSDRAGKPVVSLSAESKANGAPVLVVRDPQGTLLQTIELAKGK